VEDDLDPETRARLERVDQLVLERLTRAGWIQSETRPYFSRAVADDGNGDWDGSEARELHLTKHKISHRERERAW